MDTATLVAAVAAVVAVVASSSWAADIRDVHGIGGLVGIAAAGAAAAIAVNNLPATLVALREATVATDGMWAWLLGANVGAVLFPVGALANLLWRRIARDEGVSISASGYMRAVVPVAVPALVAAVLSFAVIAAI